MRTKPQAWTPDQVKRLKELWPKTPMSDLKKIFGRTRDAMKTKAVSLGLKREVHNRKAWTPAEDQILIEQFATTYTHDLAKKIGCNPHQVSKRAYSLGLQKDEAFIVNQCRKLNVDAGAAYRFKKGNAPWCKGTKGLTTGGTSTQFKKGNKSHTWKPIGSVSRHANGYLQRKVADTGSQRRDWRFVHVLVWEEHHGPVPSRHCVTFKSGMKDDVKIEDLELVTRSELMARNTIHRYPTALKQTIRAVSKLKRTIRKSEEHHEQ